ncbi:MAG: L,D-transpeptidase family protein [Thermodesulfovibrionales bacterium]|nr:L,D-transpeptidase family protein [Thermodesulfovibrionales bacterium]
MNLKCFLFTLFLLPSLILISPHYLSADYLKADKIIVLKGKRLLFLLKEGQIIRIYKVALGKDPIGPKVRLGDNKTPEGIYTISSRKYSEKYYLTIFISYPNERDIENAKKLGVNPGNSIAIHGLPKDLASLNKLHRRLNWTNGCIAVTNEEIEEIWKLIEDGTPVEIRP